MLALQMRFITFTPSGFSSFGFLSFAAVTAVPQKILRIILCYPVVSTEGREVSKNQDIKKKKHSHDSWVKLRVMSSVINSVRFIAQVLVTLQSYHPTYGHSSHKCNKSTNQQSDGAETAARSVLCVHVDLWCRRWHFGRGHSGLGGGNRVLCSRGCDVVGGCEC